MRTTPPVIQTRSNKDPSLIHPNDYKKVIHEIRYGGIFVVPAYLATRWGIPQATAERLIQEHQFNQQKENHVR